MERPPDAVICLGAQVFSSGRVSPSLRRRIDHAITVLGRHPEAVLVPSGGTGDAPISEAEAMRRIAIDAGVLPDRILLEDRSTSTLEHAMFLSRMAQAARWRRLCLVTDRYHMPRALFLFRRFGLEVTGDPVTGRGERAWWKWLANGYLREIPAWGKNLSLVATGRHRRLRRTDGR